MSSSLSTIILILTTYHCQSVFIDTNSTIECANNDGNCSITCDSTAPVHFCEAQYMVGYNNIYCPSDRSCNDMIVICPKTKCSIHCFNWRACDNAIIFANDTEELHVLCDHKTSCRAITIHLSSNTNNDIQRPHRALINCSSPFGVGHTVHDMEICDSAVIWANYINELFLKCDACDGIIVHGNYAKYISISSIPISTRSWEAHWFYYESLRNAVIYATNVAELTVHCTGIKDFYDYGSRLSKYACIQNSFYVSPGTANIYCNSYGCSGNTLYLDLPVPNLHIDVPEIVHVDYCDRCGDFSTDCIDTDEWTIFCNGNYDEFTIFDGSVCLDDNNSDCCDERLFNIMDDYDECFVYDGHDPNSNIIFFVVVILFSFIPFLPIVFIIIYWIRHLKETQIYRKYHIPFKKPTFPLRFILVSDCMVHILIFYGLIYFIVSTIDIKTYCQSRYPLATTEVCDKQYFCGYRCYQWWSTDICFCGVDEGILGLSVSYYILFGFYAIFEFGGWRSTVQESNIYAKEKKDCSNHSFCVTIKKEWNLIQMDSYDTTIFFQYNSFISVVMMNKFILLTLVIFEIFLYGIYVQLFPFIIVFILVIIAHILRFYYLRLPYHQRTDEVKLIVIVFFDINIGNIILSYLDNKMEMYRIRATKNRVEMYRMQRQNASMRYVIRD